MTRHQFKQQLRAIVEKEPRPLWSSEDSTDHPLEVVEILCWKAWDWKESDQLPTWLFRRRYADERGKAKVSWSGLINLFPSDRQQVTFKRPRPESSEFDLYLLVRFGWWWVGLRTVVVET